MKLSCKVSRNQHEEMSTGCAWFPSGQELVSCSDDKVLKKLDADEMSTEQICSLEGYPTDLKYCPSLNEKQPSDILAMTFSDGSFSIIQVSTGREEKRVQAYNTGAAISVGWNLDGTALATGGEDGTVKVWSRAGMLRNSVATMRHPIYCVCWGRDDALLFSSGKLLTIEQKQQKQIQWKAHDGTVLAVHWNPVNHLIVSGGEDCKYRVWDAYGRQLFVSSPLEHVVTCLAWAPNGTSFAVGAFNVLKVCDKTGWTLCRENLENSGSLLSLDWSLDGTLIGAASASGSIVVAEIAHKAHEWRNIRTVMLDSKQVEVQNSLDDHTEVLVFRDRIIDMSLDHGYLVVHTSTPQVHVYNVTDLQAPTIVDVPPCQSSCLIQSAKCFLAGWTVYTYEGRKVATPQCLNGINTNVLDRNSTTMNANFLAVLENNRDSIRLVDLAKAKPIALIKHKLAISQIALGESEVLAFLDANGDLFVQATGKKTFKLPCTMVESIKFNETGALVASCDGGNKVSVFFYPAVVWVDPDLLDETTLNIETPYLASKQPCVLSFTEHLVTIREHSGSIVTLNVSRYPALLHELINNRKWEDAIRLCRFVDQRYLWATLAGKALDKCHLDSAEIGLASLQNVAKLNYVLFIKDIENEKAKMAELALYKRDLKAAESILLQSNPPLLYRALKMNIRMHRWDRATQLAKSQSQLARMVELYEKRWKSQEALTSSETKELKAIKSKFSDKPQESDDEDDSDGGEHVSKPTNKHTGSDTKTKSSSEEKQQSEVDEGGEDEPNEKSGEEDEDGESKQ